MFDEFGGFDESLPACEDYDLWLRLCAFESVAFVSEPQIYKYGGHADQLSRKYLAMDQYRVFALDKALKTKGLSHENRAFALANLQHRLRVLLVGAEKHGNAKLQNAMQPYVEKWGMPD